MRSSSIAVIAFLASLSAGVCAAAGGVEMSGLIKADGSSTVHPITEAVAEEFAKLHPQVKITVGISGTGGGFKKFTVGETDISNASRPIKAAEVEAAAKNKLDFIELPVAFDALTVVVNPKNDWVDHLTTAELKKMWEPAAQGQVMKWRQIRPAWPDEPIRLFGPGVDSGTFDYFTEAVVGKEDASRGDFTSSEDDNVLVQGVAQDKYALGFFGLAYHEENKERLKAVAIDDGNPANGAGPQLPSVENVVAGKYQPLARPLFIYVGARAAARPEVEAFVAFYLKEAKQLAGEVGYVPLPAEAYELAAGRFARKTPGSLFASGHNIGVTIEKLLASEGAAE